MLAACFVVLAAVAALGCTGESPQPAASSDQALDQSSNDQRQTRDTIASPKSIDQSQSIAASIAARPTNGVTQNNVETPASGVSDEIVDSNLAFLDCEGLLAHYRAVTLQYVLDGSYRASPEERGTGVWFHHSTGVGVVSATGTNLRVAGIDEADFVKTDGDHIYVLTSGYFIVYTLRNGQPPELTSQTELPEQDYGTYGPQGAAFSELLIGDEKAFLFRGFGPGAIDADGAEAEATTQLIELDLTDPAAPRMLRTLDLSGALYVDAQLVDNQIRIIFGHIKLPSLTYPYTFDVSEDRARQNIEAAEEENVEIIHQAALTAWHPTYSLIDHRTGQRSDGLAVPCNQTHRPADPSAVISTYLMTLDLSTGLGQWKSILVLNDFHLMHATADNVYVASEHSRVAQRTVLHRFSVDHITGPTYLGSVAVFGSLEDQWSLDEYDGRLRFWTVTGTVAVVEPEDWLLSPTVPRAASRQADRFALPRPPNNVAFVDDRAYALYAWPERCEVIVLDLAGGTPRRIGDLEMHCRGSYFHRLDDDRLFVVGIKGDPAEEVWVGLVKSAQGVPPDVVHVASIPATYLNADWDHRAFLFANGVAWVVAYSGHEDHIAYGIRLDGDAASIEATLPTGQWVRRAIAIDRQLYLISASAEIQTFALDDYSDLGAPVARESHDESGS